MNSFIPEYKLQAIVCSKYWQYFVNAMCIVDICRAAEQSRSDESAADGGGGRETPRHDLRPRHGHPGGQGCRDLGGALQPQGHVQAAEQGGGGGKGGQEVARG